MRFEYKYLIPAHRLDELRNSILPFVNIDHFALIRPGNEYTVRSIYYDTTGLKYYYEKVDGLKVRKKVRIRGYNEMDSSSVVFLEVKRKNNEAGTKTRALLNYGNLEELFENKELDSLLANPVKYGNELRNFLFFYYRYSLKPSMLITYDREAFQAKTDSDLRITFDKNLRYLASPSLDDLYEEMRLNRLHRNVFVLEIKSSKCYPIWLQNSIRQFDLMRTSVSKYSNCIEAEMIKNPVINRKEKCLFYKLDSLRGLPREEEVYY